MENRPQLSFEAFEVIQVFRLVSATRSSNGFGPNPITLTDIKACFDLLGPPLLPIDVTIDLILKLDQKYMNLVMDKINRDRDKRGRAR